MLGWFFQFTQVGVPVKWVTVNISPREWFRNFNVLSVFWVLYRTGKGHACVSVMQETPVKGEHPLMQHSCPGCLANIRVKIGIQ